MHSVRMATLSMALAALALAACTSAEERPEVTAVASETTATREPVTATASVVPTLPVVEVDAYIALGGAKTLEDIAGFTDGAALVTVIGTPDGVRTNDERRPATAEDVREATALGKEVEKGQLVGAAGLPMTLYEVQVVWLDGRVEEATLVASGGEVDGAIHQLAGLPLPEPGQEYLFFLRRTPDGLVAEAVQFRVEGGVLMPHTFPQSGLSRMLAGKRLSDVATEVVALYESLPPRPADGVRPAQ